VLGRRGFLKLLGLGGMAFTAQSMIPKVIDWATAVPLVGSTTAIGEIPLSIEWMTAELAKHLDGLLSREFIHDDCAPMMLGHSIIKREFRRGDFIQTVTPLTLNHQYNVEIETGSIPGEVIQGDEFVARWLKPAASALYFRIPKTTKAFADLELPKFVDEAVRSVRPSGLSVRGVSQMRPVVSYGDILDALVSTEGQALSMRKPAAALSEFEFIQTIRFDVLLAA
jgi:hypothetical protein